MPSRMKTWLTTAGLAAGLLTVAACGGSDSSGDSASESTGSGDSAAATSGAPGGPEAAPEAPAMPEPDLADVPDVVAEVNGEEITGEEFSAAYEGRFQQVVMQSQASGQEVDQEQLKTQTVDGMIGNILLLQEADERELTSSSEEVNATLDELAEQNGAGSGDELLALLEEQGTTEEDAREQLETQVKVDKLIAEETQTEAPTEAELQELYDSLVAQQGGGGEESGGPGAGAVPPFEEVRPQLEDQLVQEQEAEVVTVLVEDLRAEGDVTVNL